MSVAFGSSNVLAEGTRANSTYTAPSSIADGDVLLIWHFEFNSGGYPTPTPPTGFATVPSGSWPMFNSADYAQWLWYKVASGESGNYTVTHTSAVTRGIVARITGANTTSPFAPNATQNGGNGTTTTYTGLTTTVDQELILLFGSDDNDNSNTYAVTGYTLQATTPGECLLTKTLTPAGATGSPTMTNNSNPGTPWFGVMVAMQPAAGGAAAIPALTMAPMVAS